MTTPSKIASLLLAVCLATLPLARADDPAAPQDPLTALKQFSEGSKALYKKLSPSLVRIRIDVTRDTLVTGQFRKDFEDWKTNNHGDAPNGPGTPIISQHFPDRDTRRAFRKNKSDPNSPDQTGGGPDGPGLGGPGGPSGPDNNGNPGGGPPGTGAPGAGPHNGPGDLQLLRRYLDQRQSNMTGEDLARTRLIMAKMDATRAGQNLDFLALTFDSDGHALVLFPLIRYPDNKPYDVILPDGTPATATLNAADYLRGFSVVTIQLPSPGNAPSPISLATTPPDPGELLMAVGSSRDSLNWTLASELTPHKTRSGSTDIHAFTVRGNDDRTSTFLINTDAQLTGVAFDRFAVPIASIKPTVDELTKGITTARTGKLGLKWAYVGPFAQDRTDSPALGLRPALRVTEVAANSPAATAGVLPNDYLLEVNKTPINQFPHILTELAIRPEDITLTLLRNNQQISITVKLDQPTQP